MRIRMVAEGGTTKLKRVLDSPFDPCLELNAWNSVELILFSCYIKSMFVIK